MNIVALVLALMPIVPPPANVDAGVVLDCEKNFKPLASAIYKTDPVADPVLIRNTLPLTKDNVSYLLTEKGHAAHPAIFKVVQVQEEEQMAVYSYGCSFGNQTEGRDLMKQVSTLMDDRIKKLASSKEMTESDEALTTPLPTPEFWFEEERGQ